MQTFLEQMTYLPLNAGKLLDIQTVFFCCHIITQLRYNSFAVGIITAQQDDDK